MDVLLVGLNDDLKEMRALIDSAGYRLIGEFVQHRRAADPRFFVGKGKLEELKKEVTTKAIELVVFAGALRASQHHELEKALKVQCFDRLRVILEIFTQRAHTREAKLQVELAMLQYEVPILKEWIHSGSVGERPGFMAGGEYNVDAYYETVKRKMKKVRDQLEHVRKERGLRRDHRQRRGFHNVSIAGYANAGKSSLFNVFSGEQVLVEDRLFTTLSTTTRAIAERAHGVLLTDTVGFVSDVPLWLVEAFHSTLEEVYTSDLVLLLLDVSDPIDEFRSKLDLAADTLTSGMDAGKVLPVLTKIDAATSAEIEQCVAAVRDSPFTRTPLQASVKANIGLQELRQVMEEEFRYPVELTIRIPQGNDGASLLNWLYEQTEVLSTTYPENAIEIQLRCRERDIAKIRAGAKTVTGPSTFT